MATDLDLMLMESLDRKTILEELKKRVEQREDKIRAVVEPAFQFFCGLTPYLGDEASDLQREFLRHVNALGRLLKGKKGWQEAPPKAPAGDVLAPPCEAASCTLGRGHEGLHQLPEPSLPLPPADRPHVYECGLCGETRFMATDTKPPFRCREGHKRWERRLDPPEPTCQACERMIDIDEECWYSESGNVYCTRSACEEVARYNGEAKRIG